MILLGMFAHLKEDYWIKSNTDAIKEAINQINQKEYKQELKQEEYTKIMKVALGVDGKRIEAMVQMDESRKGN